MAAEDACNTKAKFNQNINYLFDPGLIHLLLPRMNNIPLSGWLQICFLYTGKLNINQLSDRKNPLHSNRQLIVTL
jgi:hypothetical protein